MKQKIVLMLLPYWTPLIPPVGIAGLKSFLQQQGYAVKAYDGNTEPMFRELYDRYFHILHENVPVNKQGNFYNIGSDVLQDHLTAYINKNKTGSYRRLTALLVEKNFYTRVEDAVLEEMDRVVEAFYIRLQDYIDGIMTAERPGVLGLSVYRGTFPASLFAADYVRTTYPETGILVGGAVFSQELEVDSPNFKRFVREMSAVDRIIIGEGEQTFLDYLEGRLPADKKVFKLGDTKDLLEIESLPAPDYSDFDMDQYLYVPAYASRGCPFQCSFCAETINWGRYRKKTAQKTAQEMWDLNETYGEQSFLMCDSLLNPVITDLSHELMKRDRCLYWDGYLKIGKEACDTDTVLLWRQAGFYRARIGVESGSPRVLESMGKKITLDQVRQAISNLANLGIKTSTYWIIGFPGESEEDFRDTLHLIEEMKDDLYEAECNPFRYFISGQVASGEWQKGVSSYHLYPQDVSGDLLPVHTSVLDCPPSREETYDRLNRFTALCRRLSIPNPYSSREIHQADDRWCKLQGNAVPPLMELKNKENHIDECRDIEILSCLDNEDPGFSGDFDF